MQLFSIITSVAVLYQSANAGPIKDDTNEPYFVHEDPDITRPNEPESKEKGTRMNVDRNSFRAWPGAIVPYIISNDYQQWEKNVVLQAMRNIESVCCIRFRPRSNEKDFIFVTPDYVNGYNCYSYVGRQGGQQLVKMQKDCVRDSAMTHELMHACGFGHENQRPDARNYIEIFQQNIKPEYYQRAYEPYSSAQYTTYNKPYDFYSIMHYPDYAYGNGRGKTMRSINPQGIDLSYERIKISQGDIDMMRTYYNCR